MTVRFQVAFDAADPVRLAGFWQQALGYKRQDPPERNDPERPFMTELN